MTKVIPDEENKELPKISFRVTEATLREIDALWVKRGLTTRSEGIRWILAEGMEKVRTL